MNKIEVEVKLCKEDRDRLDKLTAALHLLTGQKAPQPDPQAAEPEPVEEKVQEAEKDSENKQQASEQPATQPEPEEPAQKYSVGDVQQKVVSLAAAGKKDKVKQIINEYADRVSAIPADKLDEVMGRLIALEG